MLGMAATSTGQVGPLHAGHASAYDGFVGRASASVPDSNDETVRTAVLAGCTFGEESFPIIRLMYMDGMVLRSHPDVDLITSMGPHLDAFKAIMPEASVDLNPPSSVHAWRNASPELSLSPCRVRESIRRRAGRAIVFTRMNPVRLRCTIPHART